MQAYLISMFIDNEMDLDDKIGFVEHVHADKAFKDETVELLHQEKAIRSKVVHCVPAVEIQAKRRRNFSLWRPIGILGAGLAAAVVILFFSLSGKVPATVPYRFVLYQPTARRVEIAGSFSGWNSLPLKRAGNSGYWETVLDLPKGEYRFSYILEGHQRLPDPTILIREKDGFGGENSILEVNTKV
jgi:hypothetical protein